MLSSMSCVATISSGDIRSEQVIAHRRAITAQNTLTFALVVEPALDHNLAFAFLDYYVRQVGTEVFLFNADEESYDLVCGSMHQKFYDFMREAGAVFEIIQESIWDGERFCTSVHDLQILLAGLDGYDCCGCTFTLRTSPSIAAKPATSRMPGEWPLPRPVTPIPVPDRIPRRAPAPAPAPRPRQRPVPIPVPVDRRHDSLQHSRPEVQINPRVRYAPFLHEFPQLKLHKQLRSQMGQLVQQLIVLLPPVLAGMFRFWPTICFWKVNTLSLQLTICKTIHRFLI